MLTLSELINQSDLGIRLVAGPDDASARLVAGAHVVGAREPFRWPAADWLILLDDTRLGRPALQRRLINKAAEASLCAVAIRTGAHSDAVPPAMVYQASTSRIPLLAVAPEVPFPSIVTFVDRRLVGDDASLLAHLRTAQCALREALALAAPPAHPAVEDTVQFRQSAPGAVPPDPERGDMEAAVARLKRASLKLDQGVRVVAVANAGGSTADTAAAIMAGTAAGTPADTAGGLLSRIQERISRMHLSCAATCLNDTVLVLVPTSDRMPLTTMIAITGDPVRTGISGVITEADELSGAAWDALTALRHLQHRAAAPGTTLSADELTVADWLTGSAEPNKLRRRVRRQFGGLRHYPELSTTLVRWLTDDRNVQRVADAMHVHPNTVRYRLSRVEKITCCRLSDLSVLANLYLTLLACPEELGMPSGH